GSREVPPAPRGCSRWRCRSVQHSALVLDRVVVITGFIRRGLVVGSTLERAQKLGHVAVALVRVFREPLANHRGEPAWYPSIEHPRINRARLDRLEQLQDRVPGERPRAMQPLPQRRAKRILIRAIVASMPPEPLGRHVLGRPGPPGPGWLVIAILGVDVVRDAKVG